ncbi:MAG: dTDP-rhamnosyl transferase, partial [Leifsonia sp.]|nr:dTDP-rhamnosyl transferase [Leifsonia sp.]
DASFIREFGEAMTPLGASVPVVENELDQAQHDGLSDVLGVAAGGLIVRHTLWNRLGGFDPGLPAMDDGLDLCVRVRLAGFRVVLVPSARVATAGDGIAGANRSHKASVRRRVIRTKRAAQLHRRLAYAPAAAVPIHWLTLVPLAFFRSIGRLLRKEPGAVGAEFAAAFGAAFLGIRVAQARRTIARNRVVGWAAIAPLRIPLAEVRRARALKREAAFVGVRGERRDLNFLAGGGAWTVLAMGVLGLALFAPLLGASALKGGSLLPLSDSVAQLWQNAGYGWRDIGLGFVGAADPFAAVLAVLGTLTFWQPSFSLVVLYFAALPLAALGAWLCASRITERGGLRAFAAIAWAIAPMLLIAMQSGRPAAILAHILLPWLFFAGFAAPRSWAASATTALLAAATLACAPSLAPALALVWIIALASSGRRFVRLLAIPLPAIALFAPLVWQQFARGTWLAILADPGAPVLGSPVHGSQLALGFPDGALGGWYAVSSALGIPSATPNILVPVMLAPIAALAVLSLFLRGSLRAMVALVIALLGFVTAVAAVHIAVTVDASVTVPIWPGAGLSLYWLGLVGAATIGLRAVGRFAVLPAFASVAALAIAVIPVAIAMPLGRSVVAASDGSTLPAVTTARAASHPRNGTLRITPQPNGGIAAELDRGAGTTLDAQSTLSWTSTSLSPGQQALATLAGNLTSQSGMDASSRLTELGIGYVLLAPPARAPGAGVMPAADQTDNRAATALDANALLTPIGQTAVGQLWGVGSASAAAPAAALVPADPGGLTRLFVIVGQALVIGLMLLLAIPTGRASERLEPIAVHSPRRRRRAPGALADEPVPADSDPQNGHNPPERALPLDDAETERFTPDAVALDDTVDASARDTARVGNLDGGNRVD